MRPKLFRDPIHDIIALDLGDEVEGTLWKLIQSSTFQRLRRIRQLGFVSLIYHGAEHSRFSHSLGVVHVARRMIDHLHHQGHGTPSSSERLELLCAALLHDIGHGPFSHAIEQVTGVHHERYTAQLILEEDSEIHQILAHVDPALPAAVGAYFDLEHVGDIPPHKRFLKDIVSSQLDADRQDYILRDGLATGVRIGVYDFERIQSMFTVHTHQTECHLAVSYRAREAVEGYVIARFHMYKQVYLHKAVRAAENMLVAVFRRACDLYAQDKLSDASLYPPALQSLLAREPLSTSAFVTLDDTDIWHLLKLWRAHRDPVLSSLAHGLLCRKLYKTLDLDREDPLKVARTIDRARHLAKELGHDPDYAILPDRAEDTPYRPYRARAKDAGAAPILIVEANGQARPIEQCSDLIHLLGHDSYKMWRVCMPADVREAMGRDDPSLQSST